MYCIKTITNDLSWVGANDRRLSMFEGVYSVPHGVSYNSYILMDEKTVLFDTVDKAVSKVFFENVAHVLGSRKLDYVVVQHMEPDHSATLAELLLRYPDVTVVCNSKTEAMIHQFFDCGFTPFIVGEGSTLVTGRHTLRFLMAPMVHWPEVMVTYDETDKTLFSADAFGTFGALTGSIFADEVDFERDYMDEARRYYCNIVGKYGPQTEALLKKMSAVEVKMICPLHGYVWRRNFGGYVDKYKKWSSYTPEETGVMIAYASVYGNTENAAEIIACRLADLGIKTEIFDVSVTPASEIVAAVFRYSHLIFASTTYNAGIFVTMEELLRDLVSHNIQNRTVAFVQNGSWVPSSGKLMKEILGGCKNMTVIDETVTLKSALKDQQSSNIDKLVNAVAATMPKKVEPVSGEVDTKAFFKLSYGLFVLTAREGEKDNGCIINTAEQLTSTPCRITIAINKQNFTHDMIMRTGIFNVSVLTEETPFSVFQNFGFKSGRDTDKFAGYDGAERAANGVMYTTKYTNAVMSGKVVGAFDYGTHTLFVAEVTEAKVLSAATSVTYAYYFANIKPKPQVKPAEGKVWVCKICGYVYDEAKEGVPFEKLPADWVCPVCKHPKSDFELRGSVVRTETIKSEAVKAEPKKSEPAKSKVWVCRICGYVYDEAVEGVPFEKLPADWTCPLCKHPKSDFELQK
jgi:flavorubredoxin/flavin reductase (DIM6/NTAB) family NADH-FMN oxidoreductase RutF